MPKRSKKIGKTPITEFPRPDAMELIIRSSINSAVDLVNGLQESAESFIERMTAAGVDEAGLRALVFGDSTVVKSEIEAFKNSIIRLMADDVHKAWREGINESQKGTGAVDDEWIWRVESANPCPDCAPRSGRSETYEYWESVGLPGSGFSVCNNNCKCLLDRKETEHLNYTRK